ncbi:galactokinase [Synchytrium microbalum]|uniref:Galactokinase n=1 Tax=Synchytrium microbalum TaxID=1806994 RepID=A0A507C496_9FUNG|nr:galactokinase [Synchytrium microbalum]TPX32796.1 galactokinase [Synchytrium microbalum]
MDRLRTKRVTRSQTSVVAEDKPAKKTKKESASSSTPNPPMQPFPDDDLECPPVTNISKLEDIYPDTTPQKPRYENLKTKFQKHFGCVPTFFARSPGRVNLIGEHIDYSLFPVMPMAIDRDCIIAVATSRTSKPNPEIFIANSDDRYPAREFLHLSKEEGYVEIDATVHEWTNYFKCGYKGVFEELGLEEARDMMVMVDGTVPSGAGVSSSSAFVCCSALATMIANGITMSKARLTQTAIRSEQYAGVHIGGMDQSSSIMGISDSVLLIDFYPKLQVNPISLPPSKPSPVFVIANTLVTSDKHVTAPQNYNLRVVECRMAAALLATIVGVSVTLTENGVVKPTSLRHVAEEYFEISKKESYATTVFEECAPRVLADLLAVVEKNFKDEPYSKTVLSKELQMKAKAIDDIFINGILIHAETFNLKHRAIHVLSESRRVYQFRDVCAGKPPSTGPANLLTDIGKLMNESQESCRDHFMCSCPELDEITALARASGAYGSRLTGAGWGGCSVSMVAEGEVEAFIEKLKVGYYYKKWPEWRNDAGKKAALKDVIFASRPCAGAFIVKSSTSPMKLIKRSRNSVDLSLTV